MKVDIGVTTPKGSDNQTYQMVMPDTEAEFYKELGDFMSELEAPKNVDISTEKGTAGYQLIPSAGAKFIREAYNDIYFAAIGEYPKVYLTNINPERNNYKFYSLEQQGDKVVATYGRIGADDNDPFGVRTHMYESRMYYVKLSEKLAKGYVDQSDIFLTNKPVKKTSKTEEVKETKPAKETVGDVLYRRLLAYAKKMVEDNVESTVQVTSGMVKESRKVLKRMNELKTVKAFNRWLCKLLVVSPRCIRGAGEYGVQSYLAKSKDDFAKIIEREEDLVQAMEAVAGDAVSSNVKRKSVPGFGNNFEIFEATDEQKQKVMDKLSTQLQPLVKNVYRVIPKQQKDRFNAYIKKQNIHHIKELWHGSRNCNWLSIIKNSLSLDPNAQITGKMFGQGVYFAPSSMKSWGYTDYHGTRWANGSSNTAFMGLYAVAYGKPMDVTAPLSYDFNKSRLNGYDCVHAHKGSYLHNDEIIFYDEDAVLLNYIVEFNG